MVLIEWEVEERRRYPELQAAAIAPQKRDLRPLRFQLGLAVSEAADRLAEEVRYAVKPSVTLASRQSDSIDHLEQTGPGPAWNLQKNLAWPNLDSIRSTQCIRHKPNSPPTSANDERSSALRNQDSGTAAIHCRFARYPAYAKQPAAGDFVSEPVLASHPVNSNSEPEVAGADRERLFVFDVAAF